MRFVNTQAGNCLTTVVYLDMTVSVDTAKSNSGTNDFTGNQIKFV